MGRSELGTIELLSALSPEQLETLDKQCRWHQYSANSQIADQGGEDQEVYFVIEGMVRMVNYSLSGREITFSTVRAGGYFGELSAIDGGARAMSAVAADKCRLASLPPSVFRGLLLEHSEIAIKVMSGLADTIRLGDDRIIDLCTLPAPQRIYAELMRMSEPDTVALGSWVIRPMRTHAEIASRANTTRETVTRALGHLVSNGIVERMSKSLYIRDREALAQLAQTVVSDDATFES